MAAGLGGERDEITVQATDGRTDRRTEEATMQQTHRALAGMVHGGATQLG